MAWLSGWSRRHKVTVDNTNIDADLTHFPVPVPLGTAVGQSDQDVSDIFDAIGSESLKIAVTKDDGETQIYVEVEFWDETSEKALLWVSKSDLTLTAASVTELYIYYDANQSDNTGYVGTPGNRSEVWSSDFVAVYTMAQDPSGGADCIIDSSGNGNHGTPDSTMTSADLVDGVIGQAIEFDGDDDYVEIPASSSLNEIESADKIGILATMNITGETIGVSASPNFRVIASRGEFSTGPWLFAFDITNNDLEFLIDSDTDRLVASAGLSEDTFYRVAAVYDGSTQRIYKAGSQIGSQSGSGLGGASSNDVYIGTDAPDTGREFPGIIGKVIFSKGGFSAAWIKADSHAHTDNLLTWGAEEAVPVVATNAASDVSASSATLNGNLNSLGDETAVDVYFEWGATESYGNSTTQQEMTATGAFSDTISGLTAEGTYHFRAVVTDGAEDWYGEDQSFVALKSVGQFFMFPF